MINPRLPAKDPRTIARDIPGILDALFPQLAPGVVVHLNNTALSADCFTDVPDELIASSKLQMAMLFELAFAVGEQLVAGDSVAWDEALAQAVRRQRRHFDAKIPAELTIDDKAAATLVGTNLAEMLREISGDWNIVRSPHIPGYQWISSGLGDFSFKSTLVEVKCSGRRFGSSDYRQILMYWLLSYAASIEGRGVEWTKGILLNPRLNLIVEVDFDELIAAIAAGRTKVDLLELFSWLVGDFSSRAISHV